MRQIPDRLALLTAECANSRTLPIANFFIDELGGGLQKLAGGLVKCSVTQIVTGLCRDVPQVAASFRYG